MNQFISINPNINLHTYHRDRATIATSQEKKTTSHFSNSNSEYCHKLEEICSNYAVVYSRLIGWMQVTALPVSYTTV